MYLYSESELPLYSLFTGFHVPGGIVAAGAQMLDHPLYREGNFLLNYHVRVNYLTLGINERYLFSSVVNGSKSSSFLTDTGLGFHTESFDTCLGFHNIFRAEFQEEALPMLFISEVAYKPMEGAIVSLGIEKEKGYDACLKVASRYRISHTFTALAGYQHEPDRFSAGMEFYLRSWSVCYALHTHPDLDLTHAISISWKPSE